MFKNTSISLTSEFILSVIFKILIGSGIMAEKLKPSVGNFRFFAVFLYFCPYRPS